MLPSVLGVPAFSVVLFVNSTGEIMLCFYNLPCYVLLARLLQHTHHRPRFWGIHKWVHQYVTILNTAQHFSFKCSPVQHVWIPQNILTYIGPLHHFFFFFSLKSLAEVFIKPVMFQCWSFLRVEGFSQGCLPTSYWWAPFSNSNHFCPKPDCYRPSKPSPG